jgi:hypothetical protein
MSVKTITREQYLQLLGLRTLATRHYASIKEIEEAARAITGDDDCGHTDDILSGFRGLDEGLLLLDISVVDASTPTGASHEQ